MPAMLFCLIASGILMLFSADPAEAAAELHPLQKTSAVSASVHEQEPAWKKTWEQLAKQLKDDGLEAKRIDELFLQLDTPPSLLPMGTKITELYANNFLPKKKKHTVTAFETELGIPGPWFKGVVTSQNAQTCKEYLEKHASAFALAELSSGVPQEVAVALLFVETRLGTYLGKDNAFLMLASMAVSRDPMDFTSYLNKLSGSYDHLEWIQKKMEAKAAWAYDELKALLEYCFTNAADPLQLQGSVYGAIGLCQFMPSNIARRALDGDRDGKIDLFSPADAVASLSNYLQKGGWHDGIDLKKQIKVLMSYNAMSMYARTILALAETIRRLDTQDSD